MRLTLRDELAFATVTVVHRGVEVVVPDVLVDTGAASTVVNADVVAAGGLVPEPDDVLRWTTASPWVASWSWTICVRSARSSTSVRFACASTGPRPTALSCDSRR